MNPKATDFPLHDPQGYIRVGERQHVKRATAVGYFQHKDTAFYPARNFGIPCPVRVNITADIDEGFFQNQRKSVFFFW